MSARRATRNASQTPATRPAQTAFSGDNQRPDSAPLTAPNGRPSNLNARQHAQVRTPAFKRWFGDWESAARQQQARSLIERALTDRTWQTRVQLNDGDVDPSGRLSEALGQRITRQYLTPDDVRKTFKRHGQGHERNPDQVGLTPDDVVAAIEMLRDPQNIRVTRSNNGKPSLEVSRQFADGTLYTAQVTVAEPGAIALKSAWKKAPAGDNAGAVTDPIRTSESTGGQSSMMRSGNLLVNPSDVSKIVDDNGEPLVVYHGTPSSFDAFSDEKKGSRTKSADARNGFFFTDNPSIAAEFSKASAHGSNTMPVFLNLRDPAVSGAEITPLGLRDFNELLGESQTGRGGRKDGAVAFMGAFEHKGRIFVAYSPEQIKSAIGNRGSYDPSNPDIRYSQVADEGAPAGAARDDALNGGAADTTRELGQLFDASGNPLEGDPQHDRGEGFSRTMLAYPITRAEADTLGRHEALFRFSTRGPDTTGEQGWFVDADKALEALDREASVGNAPRRGLETRLSAAQKQILRDAVQRERVEFGHDVTTDGDTRWYRVNQAGTQATPRTRWNEPLFSIDATMDGDDAVEPVDDAKAEALRRSGLAWATKTPTERMTASMAKRWDDFKTNVLGRWREGFFDQFAPIKAIEGDVSADQSAYLAARLSTGASSTMYASLLYGAPEWQNGIIGKKAGTRGLLSVMAPVKGEMNEWLGWMVAKRAEHLAATGRENNLRAEDIRKLQEGVTGAKRARYEAVATEFRAFNTDMLRMARDAGLLSEVQVQAFSKDAYYVPFYRQDESDIDADPARPFTKRGLSHQDAGIKALKGGTEALADPLENVFSNMQRLVDASLKNHAMRQTVRNASHLLTPEPEGNRGDQDVVRVMDDGQAHYYRVTDRPLLRSLSGLNAGPIAGLGLFRSFKRLLTLGVTADPAFMMRNFSRDMLAAWMMDKNGFKFATDSLRGAKDTLRSLRDHDNADIGLQTMMFSGASFVGGHAYGDDPKSQANALRRALRAKGLTPDGIDSHMASLIDTPAKWWSAYRELGDAAENANRMAVYRAALAAGKSEAEAVFEAKDLMDFSLHGSFKFMQVMSDMLPFFNARVQGVYKLGRAGAENPNQLAKRGLMVMGATLTLAAANMGNDDYDDLPEWEKDLYWHLYMPGGAHLRIPKPFELGILFGTVPERMLRAATGKDTHRESYEALIRNLGQVMAFDPTPQLFNPALETYMNYDKFRDAPIENIGDQGKLAGARYNSYISPTMVEIGRALNVSPKKLEHLWGGYLGTLGSYALGTSDFLVRKARGDIGPSLTLRDIPVVSAFVRGSGPNRSTKYAGEFYDLLNEANQVSSTINQYRESGQLEQARELLKSNRGLLGVRSNLSAAQRQAGDIRDRMDQVRASRNLSPEAKRERLDNMQKMLNRMMKSTVETGRAAQAGR